MGAEHTSVPRWPADVPSVDPAGRTLALLGFGPAGQRVVTAWQTGGTRPVWAHVADRADDESLGLLAAQVARARIGWRLMLAGPEVDVLAARSVALGLGVLDAEIRMVVTGTERKRVFCPHCRDTTETSAPVAAEVPCAGCGRRLHVYAHVSRRLGAYLGFMADAEEVA